MEEEAEMYVVEVESLIYYVESSVEESKILKSSRGVFFTGCT